MPTTTRQMATIAGVSEQTVRNYTREYGELLSPAARGEAGARLFSDEDVRIFCSITALRRENVPRDEVIERVRRGDTYIDVAPQEAPQATPNDPHQATPGPQTALSAPQALLLVRQDLQRQIDDIKHTQRILLRGTLLWGILLGAIAAYAVGAVVVWALWLAGG